MHHVLTLVANIAATPLTPAIIARVRDAVGGSEPVILSPGEAADIPLAAVPDMDAVREALDGAPIDAIATTTEGRRKSLLIADMDSTIVTGETLDELADFAGLKQRISAITARAMNGELDFKAALRERVAMLRGLPLDALDKTWQRIRLTPVRANSSPPCARTGRTPRWCRAGSPSSPGASPHWWASTCTAPTCCWMTARR